MAGQKFLGDEVELVTLDISDPHVTTLRNHSQLRSSKLASDINWGKAYLQRRKSPSTSEALVVAINQRKGETETRFLAARVINDVPQQPVVVSISPDGPISPKGLSGIILVYGLDGKVLKRIKIKDGQVDGASGAGKAPGLARETQAPLTTCKQPETDNCVMFYYAACAPLILLDPLAYLACVAAGVGLCMYQYCS